MSKKKKRILRIIIGAILFLVAFILKNIFESNLKIFKAEGIDVESLVIILLYVTAYFVTGFDAVIKAIINIFHGHIFDENFLMTLATIGAFAIGEYPEAVAVMWLYQVGEAFENYAVNRSRKQIGELMDLRPDTATVIRNNESMVVDPDEVEIGEIVLVKAGEKIPLDGIVLSGSSSINTSALTGEALPLDVKEGSEVISGCVNISGTLTIRTTKDFGDSTVSKILDLVENAQSSKGSKEKFITKFAKYYTPGVVFAALAIAVIPPIVISDARNVDWLYKALVFLMVSCPCALVISIPLGFFAGIGAASKNGILVKGSNYLESLANLETIVFDKTGTLTKANFAVTKVNINNDFSIDSINPSDNEESIQGKSLEEKQRLLMKLAASLEQYSTHPIGVAIYTDFLNKYDEKVFAITDIVEEAGYGIIAKVNGKQAMVGNRKLLEKYYIACNDDELSGTVVYVSYDSKYLGNIIIEDEIKEEAYDAIELLKANGVKNTIMLTGDRESVASKVASKLGIDKFYAKLLPDDKVNKLNEIMKDKSPKKNVAFVGDGINDAPVLTMADIGIAMGGLGSDAAIEAADVIIMTDEINKIHTATKISKKTKRLVMQNIIFALSVKGLVLILSVFGLTNMWIAVAVDVGVSLLAILNSLRALRLR